MDTELAFAISARDWPDRLHRFLADHGGARVRLTAVRPEDIVEESFDVLLIDDSCSFLTPRLVSRVRSSGRAVLGVYDPDEFPDGKDRLLECGVSDVVEAGADPDEYLAVIGRVAEPRPRQPTQPIREATTQAPPGRLVAVGGPPGGVGVTEVAITLAHHLGSGEPARADGLAATVVDLDPEAPSVAQRLGMPLHPNLLTAFDVLAHHTDRLLGTIQTRPDGLGVLPGVPGPGDWAEVRGGVLEDLTGELRWSISTVVADLGRGWDEARAALARQAHRMVAVGASTPVGVARLLDWLSRLEPAPGTVDILINRAPRDRFRREEIVEEVSRTYRPASFAFLPDDPTVDDDAWEGRPVSRGRFRRAVERWADRYEVGR